MQAIQVKYLPPTSHRCGRWKATCAAGSITTPYEYTDSLSGKPQQAFNALCAKLGWDGEAVEGQLKDGTYVYVFVRGAYKLLVA